MYTANARLLVDVSKSATRKFVRTQSKFTAAILMAKTGMRSNILGHIAIFLIEEVHYEYFSLCFTYEWFLLNRPIKFC